MDRIIVGACTQLRQKKYAAECFLISSIAFVGTYSGVLHQRLVVVVAGVGGCGAWLYSGGGGQSIVCVKNEDDKICVEVRMRKNIV
nr:hypothetical protein [Tanacetum cinerariifolium]